MQEAANDPAEFGSLGVVGLIVQHAVLSLWSPATPTNDIPQAPFVEAYLRLQKECQAYPSPRNIFFIMCTQKAPYDS